MPRAKSPPQRQRGAYKPLPAILGIGMIEEALAEIGACTSEGVKSGLARLQENVRPAATRLDHHIRTFEQQQQTGRKTGLCGIEKQIDAADTQVAMAVLTEVRLMASTCKQRLDSHRQNSYKASEAVSLFDDSNRLQTLYSRLCRLWKQGKEGGFTGDQIASSGRVSTAEPSSRKQARKRQRSEVDADADQFDRRTRPLTLGAEASDSRDETDTATLASNKEPHRSSASYTLNRHGYLTSNSGPSICQQPDSLASCQRTREAQSLRDLALGAQKLQKAARAMSQSIKQPEAKKPSSQSIKPPEAKKPSSQSIKPPEAKKPSRVRDTSPQRASNVATAILRAVGKHPTLPPLNEGLTELLCRKQILKYNAKAKLHSDGLAHAQDRMSGGMQASKTTAEHQLRKAKLAHSYSELLETFSSKELTHVGNYTLGKLIGKGSFGKVYLARHSLTNGSKVVLKASSKEDPNLVREIHHHRQFVHPHIARLYEVIVTEEQVWLALEYCAGDELYNYLCRKGPLAVETVQKIFTQLAGAVAYIHSRSCVHRDLKLENVLLDKHDNVKLVDFGFTREYEGKASYLQTFCGTVCYSAPEMLRGEKYAGEKVDVWSLGIILYALLKGELPFDEDDDVATKAKILKEDPVMPDTFPEAAKSLILKMLCKRPFPRPSLSDILADPFLADHAPQQQAILKLSQPAPFTTPLERATLERMKSAGVDIDKVIENVLAQRCDVLAGWWALLIEKERRKESRRERKRREREADMKVLRRLSGASGRLSSLVPLEQVDEEGAKEDSRARARSSSRGRAQRRNTPQILITDLPLLPEGSTISSPANHHAGTSTPPPPPIDKDSLRSRSESRPPLPPKERPQRRSSNLQLVAANPGLYASQSIGSGLSKRRKAYKQNHFLLQIERVKHWFIESAKRTRSPGKTSSPGSTQSNYTKSHEAKVGSRPITGHQSSAAPALADSHQIVQTPPRDRAPSSTSLGTHHRNSYGATLTPVASNGVAPTVDTSAAALRQRVHRKSLSPSPITPRSSTYRRSTSGVGLRGRKSTSSSVSSVRSFTAHPAHSKASSLSSNSMSTIHSPTRRSIGRSPHSSIKVLPATPLGGAHLARYALNIEAGEDASGPSGLSFGSKFNETAISPTGFGVGSIVFAKRGRKAFKGPMLNPGLFGDSRFLGPGSPAIGAGRGSEAPTGRNLGHLVVRKRGQPDLSPDHMYHPPNRKSLILEEDEEELYNDQGQDGDRQHNHDQKGTLDDDITDDGEIEEVDDFSDVETSLRRGERVHSIVIYDEPADSGDPDRGLDVRALHTADSNSDFHRTNTEDDFVDTLEHPEVPEKEDGDKTDSKTNNDALGHTSTSAAAQATMAGRWAEKADVP
ncbi:hypothetical protein DV735_g1218, partial [Chaetothyriales sp. CBS 134920]